MTTPQFPGIQGKVALVTGGTSGIGKATVLALAANGAHVVLTGRRAKEGEEVAEQARKHNVKATFVQGDVTDETHVKNAVSTALSLTGKLNLAFNNAGVELGGTNIADSTAEQYRKVFDINVLGVMLSMKHQIPALLKSGGGSIVNNASVAARIGMPGVGIYVASKHAVLGFTRVAALEVAKQGIRINSVSPGAIESEMFDRVTGGNSDALAYMTSLHPIGRIGKGPEIANPVLFLLSDASSFVTGHDLVVDGGVTVP